MADDIKWETALSLPELTKKVQELEEHLKRLCLNFEKICNVLLEDGARIRDMENRLVDCEFVLGIKFKNENEEH